MRVLWQHCGCVTHLHDDADVAPVLEAGCPNPPHRVASKGTGKVIAEIPEITERHCLFLRSRGYGYAGESVESTQRFVDRLTPSERAGFFAEADAWDGDLIPEVPTPDSGASSEVEKQEVDLEEDLGSVPAPTQKPRPKKSKP